MLTVFMVIGIFLLGVAVWLLFRGEVGYGIGAIIGWAAVVALYYGEKAGGPTWPGSLILTLGALVVTATSLYKWRKSRSA